MATTRTIEKNGEMYELIQVSSGRQAVGWAPCPILGSLEEMQAVIEDQKIFDLALRQLKEDVKNKVRTRPGMPTLQDATKVVNADKAKYQKFLELVEAGTAIDKAMIQASGLGVSEDYEGFAELERAMK